MPKSNTKLLTKDERKFFKDNYSFSYADKFVLVKVKTYDRTVAHGEDEDFNISTKARKIKITKEAIKLWRDKFYGTEFSLVDVQNAMNALMIGYQATDYDDVKNQLERIKQSDEKSIRR